MPSSTTSISPSDPPGKTLHAGHRARMLRRLTTRGADVFTHAEAVEILLFEPLPRRNTNGIAHDLASRLGSLGRVLRAARRSLRLTRGVGPASAAFLASVLPRAGTALTEAALAVLPDPADPAEPDRPGRPGEPEKPDAAGIPPHAFPVPRTLLAAADFRFRLLGESAAVVPLASPAWLPARGRKALFGILAALGRTDPDSPCLILLSEGLAGKLAAGSGSSSRARPSPDALLSLFPPSARVFAAARDRSIREIGRGKCTKG